MAVLSSSSALDQSGRGGGFAFDGGGYGEGSSPQRASVARLDTRAAQAAGD